MHSTGRMWLLCNRVGKTTGEAGLWDVRLLAKSLLDILETFSKQLGTGEFGV